MVIDKINKYRIILASRSPRRQQLLREMGIQFVIAVREYDESFPPGLSGIEIAEYISAQKARTFKDELTDNDIVITADTVVWCNDKVLGKPADTGETIRMLKEISGNTHDVITAVSIVSRHREVLFSDVTKVTFARLTEDEMRYYAEKYTPFDKAGAYGIQEWIGIIGCTRVEGSYFNVVGLPVQRLYEELKKFVEFDRPLPNPPLKRGRLSPGVGGA